MNIIDYQAVLHARSLRLLGRGFCVLIASLLFAMPIAKFISLHSDFYDLGQYATLHYGIAFHGGWGRLFATHAHLLAVPYVLIYRLFPGNLTLVVLQSAVVVLSAGLYLAYWQHLKLPFPVAGVLLYLLSFSTWFAVLFDFHFEHLIFPIIFGFFLVVELSDRPWAQILAVAIGLLLCLVKEVYPLSAAMLGLYLILAKRWYAAGAVLFLVSLVYFFFVTLVAIPHFSGGASTGELWNSGFGYLGHTTTEILHNILGEPLTLIRDILGTPRKLLYLFVLLGWLAFLPLFRPLALLPALPIIGISLLSHNVHHYYLGHQYTVPIAAVTLIAAAQAMKVFSDTAKFRWVTAMLVTAVVAQIAFGPSPISRLFWSANIFNYHWTAYVLDDHDRKLKQAIEDFVPVDDRLVISMQNAINTDRLTNRSLAASYPYAVFDAANSLEETVPGDRPRSILADFVVLDRHRPLSFQDDICVYDRKVACADPTFVARFDSDMRKLRLSFIFLYDTDGIIIAKRRD
jgi:uncharacterized membrane protein